MRFDSIANLVEFLGVLSVQGYSVPFKDYDKDMKNHGLVKHIHNYKTRLETISPKSIKLVFDAPTNEEYSIVMIRHDFPTNEEIENMHKEALKNEY